MEYICLVIIALIVYMFILGSYRGNSINSDVFSKIWILITLIAFIMAFIFEPNPSLNLDLLRLNARLDTIRSFGLENALKYSGFEGLYIFENWLYLVSLTEYNSLLTAVPFAIDVYIFGKIVSDILCKVKVMKFSYLTFGLFTWVSLIGLKLAITDIRCVFAMTICCYALYLEFIKNECKFFSVLLYLVAFFTHHYAVTFLISRVIVSIMIKIKSKNKLLFFTFVTFLIPIFINSIVTNMVFYNDYLALVIVKFVGYQDRAYFVDNALSQKILYISMLIVVLYSSLFSYSNLCFYKNEQDTQSIAYKSSLALLSISILLLGFYNNYLMIERGLYILSGLFPIAYLLMPEKLHRKRNPYILIPILLYILFINDINTFIVNKLGYSYLRL
ncbi:hypothetical protein [Phascolarctobacterium succinatutens]|uniref:hypothetical protein n=1 Tax=Phascolarctobacterium succinatutens TaxID=626940 RepID=UPI0026EF4688|nr:hypothetical protein [Phascolarctobacterium succinatutens]